MQSLINNYEADDELELRIKLTNLQIIDIYNKYINDKNIINKQEKSLTITHNGNRKEIYYNNKGNKIKELYINKERKKYIKLHKYKKNNVFVSLSKERDINKFNVDSNSLLRFRNRTSFIINENWRLDITHVKTINNTLNILNVKQKFIDTNIFENDKIDINLLINNSKLELEFEYIKNKVNKDSIELEIDEIINNVNGILIKDFKKNNEYFNIIFELAKKIELNKSNKYTIKTLKQLSIQVKTLDFSTYKSVVYDSIQENNKEFYVTDKTDGERCYLYINNSNFYIITSELTKLSINDNKNIYILDCEIIDKNIYIFDLLFYNKNLVNLKLINRLEILNDIFQDIVKINNTDLTLNIKKHVKYDNNFNKHILEIIKESKKKYEIDGLIFTENNTHNNMEVYKWKMPETQTIDFLVVRLPNNMINKMPYSNKKDHTIFLLFNTISLYDFQRLNLSHIENYNNIIAPIINNTNIKNNRVVFPYAFRPIINTNSYIYYHPNNSKFSIDEITNNICEFGCKNKLWNLKRIRHDRKNQIELKLGYGNYYTVAEDIYKFFLDPFTIDKLLKPLEYESKGYFTYNKTQKYKSMIKFNSFVKANLIQFLENSDLVIDLACGKGQDLFTMHGLGIKHMIMVDNDLDALLEINKRKNNINDKKYYTFLYNPSKKYSIKTLHLDVIKNPENTIKKIKELNSNSADGIIINFAIHYMLSSITSIKNIVNIVDNLLKKEGVFIFTCFDGSKITELLKDTKKNECFNIYEEYNNNTEIKYSIKKLYDNPEYGKIGVKHHFSETYYEEYVVNIENVIKEFINKDYTVLKKGSFGNYLDNFRLFNKNVYDSLTNNDKIYSSLYSYVMIIK